MGTIKPLDSPDVNTNSILSIYKNNETQHRTQEIEELEKAFTAMKTFWATPTPKYVNNKKPVTDKFGMITNESELIEETQIYQFKEENKPKFDEQAQKIDKAMSVTISLVVFLTRELKSGNASQIPLPPGMNAGITTMKENSSIWDKLNPFKKSGDEMQENPNDEPIKELIALAEDVRKRWGIYKQYYAHCIYKPGKPPNFASIHSRRGMEVIHGFFEQIISFYLEFNLMMIFKFAKDLEVRQVTDDANAIILTTKQQQKEHEGMMQSM